MATQVKYTAKHGVTRNPGEVVIAAGAAEAQSDTISINVDFTKMSRGEAVNLIERIKDAILTAEWPAL